MHELGISILRNEFRVQGTLLCVVDIFSYFWRMTAHKTGNFDTDKFDLLLNFSLEGRIML